jgi:hypothetical protein
MVKNEIIIDDKKQYNNLKKRIPNIKSLAMLKMEKNFIAIEKNYSRQPYFSHSLIEILNYLEKEVDELKEALNRLDIINLKEEIADISNVCDYFFERIDIELCKE